MSDEEWMEGTSPVEILEKQTVGLELVSQIGVRVLLPTTDVVVSDNLLFGSSRSRSIAFEFHQPKYERERIELLDLCG